MITLNSMEEMLTQNQILEDVLFDLFPNAKNDEELEYELDCYDND